MRSNQLDTVTRGTRGWWSEGCNDLSHVWDQFKADVRIKSRHLYLALSVYPSTPYVNYPFLNSDIDTYMVSC